MRKRKVAIVVTSRASYARIKSAIRAIHQRMDLDLQLVVGASALLEKYGSSVDMMERDGIVGPGEGAKPREILVKADYFDELDRHNRAVELDP